MKTTTKRILLISFCMILAGIILTGLGHMLGGSPGVSIDSNGIRSANHPSKSYRQEKRKIESFQNLNLQIDSYADVCIVPSDDDNFYLEYLLPGDYNEPEYAVKDNTFTFSQKSTTNGFLTIGTLGFFTYNSVSDTDDYPVTLYIPEDQSLGNVTIYNSYADVTIKGLSCDNMELTVESGNISLDSTEIASLTLDCEYGEVTLKDFSGDTAELTTESDDVTLDTVKINTLSLSCGYGDVTIKEFSGDTIDLEMESGDLELDIVKISHLTCDMEYGDIRLTLPDTLEDYSISAETEYGELLLPSDTLHTYYTSNDYMTTLRTEGTTDKTLTLHSESGDVELRIR